MSVTLYQAGAGSGKTFTITKELVQRLADGSVRPERVLATTFTRKAAAELKDRIQQRLLHPEDGDPPLSLSERLELACAIDESLIGTVHSVGHQLLLRYALHLGISPQLEPLEEKAQERHLRRIFAEMPREGLRDLDRLARRFCMDDVQDTVLKLLDAKRSNAIPDQEFRDGILASVERLIEVMSGGTSIDLQDFDGLYEECRETLARIEGNGDVTKTTAKARREVEDALRAGRSEWRVWGKIGRLSWAKKSETETARLTALARRANVHSLLHADLRAFAVCLVDRVLELQSAYRTYKEGRGLLDFTDLMERFLELLQDDAVRSDLALDLVVVDEFQDTNPIQLALFQALASTAKASIWVGDEKQAIYGFRGTDPSLMADVIATVQARPSLEKNWRSQAGLVRFVNRVFEPLFGEGTSLEPVRDGPSRVERWSLSAGRREDRQSAFVAQMQALTEDVAPGDVAVLVRKNEDAKALAAALQEAGVPALVATSGLLSTREGAMLLAGLRLVVDPKDRLAAAIVRHVEDSEDTPAWFQEVVADPEGVLGGLDELRSLDARTLPPSGVVGAVVQALRLPDRILEWGEPGRRSANLDALLALGARYEDEAGQEGKAATVTGLVYWLEDLRKKEEDLLPVPAGVDAVQITTLWGAKGLEWPCVVLYQDGEAPPPNPFSIQVTGGNAAEGRPLEGRTVRYWPYPFGYTFKGGMNADGSGIQESARQSSEGQALRVQRDEETKRLLYVGFTRARDTLVIAEGGKNPLGLLHLGDLADVADADGFEFVQHDCRDGPVERDGSVREEVWFDEARGAQPHPLRYHSPSKEPAVPCEAHVEKLPGPHPFPVAIRTDDWTNLGQAVHSYLAAVPALRSAQEEVRVEHARSCLRRWNREGDLEAEALVRAGDRLVEWVEHRYPDAQWHVEVPATRQRVEGGQWAGVVDLVLVQPDGAAIVDHKSADWDERGWSDKVSAYSGQLTVYTQMVEASTTHVHLALAGAVGEVKARP